MTHTQLLINTAVKALTVKGFEKRPSYCARWLRQVVEEATNDASILPDWLDARAQFYFLQAKGFAIPVSNGSVPGDLLYKIGLGQGLHGHCGIRVPGNHVAENSSYHSAYDSDARGMREIEEFGRVTGIIRLPQSAFEKNPRLVIRG